MMCDPELPVDAEQNHLEHVVHRTTASVLSRWQYEHRDADSWTSPSCSEMSVTDASSAPATESKSPPASLGATELLPRRCSKSMAWTSETVQRRRAADSRARDVRKACAVADGA